MVNKLGNNPEPNPKKNVNSGNKKALDKVDKKLNINEEAVKENTDVSFQGCGGCTASDGNW